MPSLLSLLKEPNFSFLLKTAVAVAGATLNTSGSENASSASPSLDFHTTVDPAWTNLVGNIPTQISGLWRGESLPFLDPLKPRDTNIPRGEVWAPLFWGAAIALLGIGSCALLGCGRSDVGDFAGYDSGGTTGGMEETTGGICDYDLTCIDPEVPCDPDELPDGQIPGQYWDYDEDCDGIINGKEDFNNNCQQDADETDPSDYDTDDDCFVDRVELEEGTDPLDPTSFPEEEGDEIDSSGD